MGQIWMQSAQPVQRAASMMGRWRRVVLLMTRSVCWRRLSGARGVALRWACAKTGRSAQDRPRRPTRYRSAFESGHTVVMSDSDRVGRDSRHRSAKAVFRAS